MSKRRKRIVLLAFAVLTLALAWAFLSEREPSYQGRTLSEWFDHIDKGADWSASAETVVRSFGTNAIPISLKWIKNEDSFLRQKIAALVEWLHPPLIPGLQPYRHKCADQAVFVFEVLGVQAHAAIPELTRLALTSSDPVRADRCVTALSFIGPQALPSFLILITNGPTHTRSSAVSLVRYFQEPEAAVPVLTQCLDDKDSSLADKAAETLSSIAGRCAVIQDLTNAMRYLSSQGRVRAIESIHWAAPTPTDAAGALIPFLTDADFSVREATTNVLRTMASEVLSNAPPR